MSSRHGLAAIFALMMLGCATKQETTQTAQWERQAEHQDEFMGDKRLGGAYHTGTSGMRKKESGQ
jgi:hypothetical protein